MAGACPSSLRVTHAVNVPMLCPRNLLILTTPLCSMKYVSITSDDAHCLFYQKYQYLLKFPIAFGSSFR